MPQKFDVIVIGSGGGSKITRPAANLGHKVAIIEQGRLGGTCLNHGCIPSKMLIHPADVVNQINTAKKFDIQIAAPPKVDYTPLAQRVNRTIDEESFSIAPLYEKHPNITYFSDKASFVSDKVISVNGHRLTADKIFIATGARANIPLIPGLKGTPYLTYKEALKNTKLPKSMIVVGGGYIATELGYCYGSLGCDVSFVVRSCFLRQEDEDISEAFSKSFSKRFKTHFGYHPQKVRYENGQFCLTCQCQRGEVHTLSAEALLMSTGVRPNTDLLGLKNTKINRDHHGYIQVDNQLQTSVNGIYAFGDILGRHLFRHTANYEGEYLFKNIFLNKTRQPIVYPPIPHAVFSNPQIAGVGEREKSLIDKGIDYVKGINPYKSSAMGMALLSEEGFAKILVDKQTKKILGAHIMGHEASIMIHMMIAYMKMDACLDDLLDTIYIHPALPEILRNAAKKAAEQLERYT